MRHDIVMLGSYYPYPPPTRDFQKRNLTCKKIDSNYFLILQTQQVLLLRVSLF